MVGLLFSWPIFLGFNKKSLLTRQFIMRDIGHSRPSARSGQAWLRQSVPKGGSDEFDCRVIILNLRGDSILAKNQADRSHPFL